MNTFIQYLQEFLVSSNELLQNTLLRISTANVSQRKSRQQLITEHESLEFYGDKNEYFVRYTGGQEVSTPNLLPQLKISIANLQVNHVPIGKFFVMSKDPEGNVERLALYNWINQIKKVSRSIKFYVGTQLAVKNPSLKIAADGNTIIHSGKPEDVIINHNNKLFSDLSWTSDLLEGKVKRSVGILILFQTAIYEYSV